MRKMMTIPLLLLKQMDFMEIDSKQFVTPIEVTVVGGQ